MKEQYLAIDIGGTFMKYSVMNKQYEVLEEYVQPTKKEPEAFLNQLLGIGKEYKDKVEGVALCIAGFINPETGENTDFGIRERFKAYNLKEELENITKLPVILENDSNCAALGEMVCGSAKEVSDFCLLTIGTGIGGAIVLNKQLVRGKHFKAGEAGYMLIGLNENGEQVNGESAGATSVLVKKVSEIVGKEIDGMYVFKHLDNPEIYKIYKHWIYKNAVVVGNMALLLDPEVVLIGGGISHEKRFIDDLRKAVFEIYPHFEEYTKILPCKMGNLAGRVGALYLWLEKYGKKNES